MEASIALHVSASLGRVEQGRVMNVFVTEHVVCTFIWDNVNSLCDIFILVLIVDTLESAIICEHFLAVWLISCNIFVVFSIGGKLSRFEHRIWFLPITLKA